MKVTINTSDVEKGLKKFLGSLDEGIDDGLEKVARKIQGDAYDKVPNDTGELVRSYKYFVRFGEMEAGYDVEYAEYQHRGSRRDGTHIIRNRPAGGQSDFLYETVEQNIDDYNDTILNEIIK